MIKKGKIIRTNTALEKRYADALEKMASKMTTSAKREIMRLLDKHKDTDNLSIIEGISSQTRILLNKLDAEWEGKFIDVSRHMTPRMMRNVLRESKSATVSALKPLFEDKTISLNDSAIPLQNVFKASVNQAVELFRTIPEQYFADIKGSVMRSITGGGSLKDLIAEIDKHSDKTVHRSVNIALDQTRKAYQGFSRNMALEAGVKEGIWVHTGGTTDPRLKHKAFNGKKFNLADGAPVGTMKGGNEYVHPGEEPFCLPHNVLVNNAYGIKNLIRRPYNGKLSVLTMESGVSLPVTSNHNILTNRGWVAASDVKIGDYVINTSFEGGFIFKEDCDKKVSQVGDLFGAFVDIISFVELLGLSKFDCQFSENEVDIIDVDNFLAFEHNAAFLEFIEKEVFANSDDLSDIISGNSICAALQSIISAFGASNSVMRCSSEFLALIIGKIRHSDYVGLGAIAKRYAAFCESIGDNTSGNIELFRESQDAHSVNVEFAQFIIRKVLSFVRWSAFRSNDEASFSNVGREIIWIAADDLGAMFNGMTSFKQFDRVTNVEVSDFSAHVYNLETVNNWYCGNNLIIHNCRCAFKPVIDFASAA